jgi:glycosyltransferase involved in cell wall biosynthesis
MIRSVMVVRELRGERVRGLAQLTSSAILLAGTQYEGDLGWSEAGIEVLRCTPADRGPCWPASAEMRWSEAIAQAVEPFDVVWFADCVELAMYTLRKRRFARTARPGCVVVAPPVPGSIGLRSLPALIEDFLSRYARQHADFVAPVDDWGGLLETAARMGAHPQIRAPHPPATSPAVTVCVPYFNHARFLPPMLESLARQTCRDFTVIVVDDGSTAPGAQEAFARMQEQYGPRGWRFVRQENSGPSGARNHAVRLAATEFVLFYDADDFAPPNLVERLLEAACLSGDDVLACEAFRFLGDSTPLDPRTGNITVPRHSSWVPVGNHLAASICDDVHGGPVMIVRRVAMQAIGGFTPESGPGFEDYEFIVRLALAGFRVDVVPQTLHFYRDVEGGVSKITDTFLNHERILRNYRPVFNELGLHGLAEALHGTYSTLKKVSDSAPFPWPRRRSRQPGRARRRLRILMLIPYPPDPAVGGGGKRSYALVEYFARRHYVTALCLGKMPDRCTRVLKQLCQRVFAVDWGPPATLPPGAVVPTWARQCFDRGMQAAVNALGWEPWDVTIFDQIYMALYRFSVDGFHVLGEQNIESQLLGRIARLHEVSPSAETAAAVRDAQLMERLEDETWREFPLRFGVSRADCDAMDRRARRGRTVLAPNGCNPDNEIRDAQPDRKTVLFPATLDYYPNIDALAHMVDEIWPLVKARMPGAQLVVAGRKPGPVVRSVAARAGARVVADPLRMEDVARNCSAVVVPLRAGGGTRIKILDAMAMGLPVVSTALGCEGLDVADDQHLLIRDDPSEFAGAVIEVLTDEVKWRMLRKNGMRLVRERYSWDQSFHDLEVELLRELGMG